MCVSWCECVDGSTGHMHATLAVKCAGKKCICVGMLTDTLILLMFKVQSLLLQGSDGIADTDDILNLYVQN